MKRARVLPALIVVVVGAAVLTACNPLSTLSRPWEPVVVTGAQVPAMLGAAPERVVAFRHERIDETSTWTQIPVQVDQRKVVPFGVQPGNNSVPGVVGTVYGNGTGGPTALQYADPDTWVGADTDPNVDGDDEIVVMGSDAGGQARDADGEPAGVVARSGVAVKVSDPRGTSEQAWVYLFRSTGSLDPAAGQDYVRYDFELTSGAYKTTYQRADGPNPETSAVETDSYRIELPDRWMETSWQVTTGSASGVDILDAYKNQFGPDVCGRSNATFADAEGAFVANIDGPVRAIRAYIGANSGPLTQRTHLFYADREDVITDLRVHAIPGIIDFVDYSSAATGMTYRSNQAPNGQVIDGVDDPVGSGAPRWESVDGPQGRIYTRVRFDTSIVGIGDASVGFYRDQSDPAEEQCFGDGAYLGASGTHIADRIANTDPRSSPVGTLRATRTVQFLPPASDPSKIAAYADDWARDLDAPFTLEVSAYTP